MLRASFTAFPVKVGDAFLLQTDGLSLLVDGGMNITELPPMLRASRVYELDIVVCSHNDLDHAGGIIGLLETRTITVGELWLPARWREALEIASKLDAGEIFDHLRQEAEEEDKRRGSLLPDPLPAPAESSDEAPLEPEIIAETLLGSYGSIFKRNARIYRAQARYGLRSSVLRRNWSTLKNIRRIAIAAHARRVPVRWLEYSTTGPHHRTGPVRALNGRARRPKSTGRLGDVLYLTTVNREALVVLAELDGKNDVLFSSDSGLTPFLKAAPRDVAVITAPHHGSNDPANVAAYKLFNRDQHLLVRSDRAQELGSSRPCPEYLAWPRTYCTRCRGVEREQVVRLQLDGEWHPDSATRPCICQ